MAGPRLPGWASGYLPAQGALTTLLALALLFAPARMVAAWPWQITPLLAQIYSAPFLSYGIGSLLLSRGRTWDKVRIPAAAMLVFAAGVLLASWIHRGLFSTSDLSDWLWFVSFALATVMLGLLTARALRSAPIETATSHP